MKTPAYTSATSRIIVDPAILVGKPVIKGTRVPVELILRRLADGQDTATIKKAHPHISKDDILACIAYAPIIPNRS